MWDALGAYTAQHARPLSEPDAELPCDKILAIARVMVVLSALAGCGLPTPPNATPCERAPGTMECQIWMYDHAR